MSILHNYIPEKSIPRIHDWLEIYKLHLKIVPVRRTKFGDFRPKHHQKPARITINNDLNKYHFLITLVHEIAHAAVWEKHSRKARPHGLEWQEMYKSKMSVIMELEIFPQELIPTLHSHMQNVKASTCSDAKLYRSLKEFDKPDGYVFLSELKEKCIFKVRGGKQFIKGQKRRTRYLCTEVSSKRNYLVSGHAEVIELNTAK